MNMIKNPLRTFLGLNRERNKKKLGEKRSSYKKSVVYFFPYNQELTFSSKVNSAHFDIVTNVSTFKNILKSNIRFFSPYLETLALSKKLNKNFQLILSFPFWVTYENHSRNKTGFLRFGFCSKFWIYSIGRNLVRFCLFYSKESSSNQNYYAYF